jgi:hypothetical protein
LGRAAKRKRYREYYESTHTIVEAAAKDTVGWRRRRRIARHGSYSYSYSLQLQQYSFVVVEPTHHGQ